MIEKKGLNGKVIVKGHTEEINSVLSAMDVFVLPSEREGFSRVLLEAMACSLPIAATGVGGNAEAIEDGTSGILVDYGDIRQLRTAVETFLEDPQKARLMGEEARKRAEDLFSMDKHVRDIQELYERLI